MDDASRDGDSIRELLLGMGGSSMRKSYYPELRGKLDDLELFRELVERSSDAIFLFAIPAYSMLFANRAAREAFRISAEAGRSLRIQDVFPASSSSEFARGLEAAEAAGDCAPFIERRNSDGSERRYELVINRVSASGGLFGIAIARDSTERILLQEKIASDLLEKESMLREIHHRVKNNFQLMKSMLALQSSSIDDDRARIPLIEAQNRIMSMASIHERLYESPDLARVGAREYFEDLVSSIRANFDGVLPSFRVSVACDEIALSLEMALPCGLIANELVSNCFRHAFPPGIFAGAPAIAVAIRSIGEGWAELAVSDNGIGIGAEQLAGEASTVGFTLIRALIAQIHGEVSWLGGGGTVASVRFPL